MLTENQLFANRYLLVKRLGQGAFSEVWKAEDTKTGNLTVALKIYAPDKGLDEDGAKVFSEEFAIVFNIHHQNLLTPTYYAKENGSPYLVLPFCEQGSALKLVGKMGERQVAQFLHDVAAALAYLHGKGIVHQDIKPDNVLMDSEGTFLVTDFGISTRIRSTLRRSVGDKKSAGTMAYMGPERFSKNPDPIKASDVWSLGTTVFEMMKGDVPFGDMGGGMQMAGALVPDIPGDYSVSLKQLVEQCLAKETWDRPTAAQLRDICEHYLRTGTWDLSSLGKVGTQEPEKQKEPAGRPTQRKLKPNIDNPKITTDTTPSPTLAHHKVQPWVRELLIGAAMVLALMLMLTLFKGKKLETKDLAKTYTVNDKVSFTMKYVQGGKFEMGSEQGSISEWTSFREDPVHWVTLSDFCIGETEVKQELWEAVMGSNPSSHKGANLPVENVSWDDCQEFISKLNKLTKRTFRLPTEAEWEYAARGGKKSLGYQYAGGNILGNVAWYDDNSLDKPHPVKGRLANELGLYDMSGNVCEWCSDWYEDYSSSPQDNPTGPSMGTDRIARGGHWFGEAEDCRVSDRWGGEPSTRESSIGFRLALSK